MSANSIAPRALKAVSEHTNSREDIEGVALYKTPSTPLYVVRGQQSTWSQSIAKRLFDFLCVLLVLPLLLPFFLIIAFVIRLTSEGPAFFLQKRTGRQGRVFTILKFRTMEHVKDKTHNAVTTTENQRFTPIGPFLRRWKIDELPQVLNVLVGDMSLVGPRPLLPEHQYGTNECRPGITGAATIAFAREEKLLTDVPKHQLDTFYHSVILPAKRQLDASYMARATFSSDFKLICKTVLRHWDSSVIENLVSTLTCEADERKHRDKASSLQVASRMPTREMMDEELLVAVEECSNV